MQENQMRHLLNEVKTIIVKNNAENYKQGKEFNIFYIQGIADNEVKVCRFIKELLDPKGSHGQGAVFLKSFVKNVLKMDDNSFSDDEYSKAQVTREELIDESRRIDLVLRINDRIFPIEVKIYASDQERQCYDYYNYAEKKDPQTKIYYLTRYGHEPSNESKMSLSNTQYECISFSEDILNWLDDSIGLEEILQIYSIKEILIQFRRIIRDLTGAQKGKLRMEIKKEIESSYDNIIAAVHIANSLPLIKADKMKEVFECIKKHMTGLGLKESIDYFVKEADSYYEPGRKSSTWPSVNYVIPVESDTLKSKIVLRFEIDHRLYFGVAPWYGANNWSGKKTSEAKEYVATRLTPADANVEKETSNWFWWRYLDDANPANYREENEEYLKLYDSATYQEYMNNVYATIDAVIRDIWV